MFTKVVGSTFGILHDHTPKEKKALLAKKKELEGRQKKKGKANKKGSNLFKKKK